MTLTWRHDAHGWIARCGEELQGEARVVSFRGGWAWIVDMLPCSAEPAIVSNDVYVHLPDAQADAERQVQEWPTPIDGARRV
ncbi:hypothetical protein KPL78_19245 [Roseomonas sp. HJA6]|uniref:Uncharacterized protein n=1 Tax=Roseomonas alba TaxID=2846776 RepID=A0ABS7AD69_9PROT|nr:hypothetical protein [Neoroseomonas alba]MBW6400005.1 hypothetical protein [Neoroseomonas alba]